MSGEKVISGKVVKCMEVVAGIVMVCFLLFVVYLETIHQEQQMYNRLEYEKEQRINIVARCKNVGKLSVKIANDVVNKVPLNDVLYENDTKDSVYIKIKAYSSIILLSGDADYISAFQTDMIIDCLTGVMDDPCYSSFQFLNQGTP